MSVLFILIPVSLAFATAFLGVVIWAVRSGQFEDTCTPSMRLLADDEAPAAGKGNRNSGVQDGSAGAGAAVTGPGPSLPGHTTISNDED